jgi:hypothetical protein
MKAAGEKAGMARDMFIQAITRGVNADRNKSIFLIVGGK